MNDLWFALAKLTKLFAGLGIDYAVMGGVAVRFYGIPRPTYDLDFTISASRDSLSALYSALEQAGFSVPEPFRSGWCDTVAEMPLVKLKLYVRNKPIDLDVFLAESQFQRSMMSRRTHATINGVGCDIVSAEDLILLKLAANRPRDHVDITDVLFTQGQLDTAYLRHWANELGVLPPLEAKLQEQGYN
ncbi:MAG: hypothetical protein ACT4QC_02035 [Planctomycetaceae bacterium]